MMAFTREGARAESFLETSPGSRFSVSGETSANTGVAPWYKMQLVVAQKVMGVVIASSPVPSPAANAAPCNAAVPELKLTACRAPIQAANRSSNSPILGPVVSQSDLRTFTTSSTSASSTLCRPYGNNTSRTGVPPWMANVSSFGGKILISGGGWNRIRSPLSQTPPIFPTHAASASVHYCRSNNGSLPEAAWRLPSSPISTMDARVESRTYLQSRAFDATRLQRPALRATSLPDESRCTPPGTQARSSPPGPLVAC